MLVNSINENVFNTKASHIVFAINKEGYNDAGFAGAVVAQGWKEIENCGKHEIGTVLSKTIGDKTFHGIVCHSLNEGWGDNQVETIKNCFNNIPVDDDEPISSIAIGTGFVGRLSGANFKKIVRGMHESNKTVILHSGFTLEELMEFVEEDKNIIRLQKKN